MCADRSCPLRESCYRYRAIVASYRQAYFLDSPRQDPEDTCRYYWPIAGRGDIRTMEKIEGRQREGV